MAEAAVSFARECSDPRRAVTPKMTTPATMAATTTIPIHEPWVSLGSSDGITGSEVCSPDGWVSVGFFSAVLVIRAPSLLIMIPLSPCRDVMIGRFSRRLLLSAPAVQKTEDCRNEHQRCNCRQQQAADHGAAQRSVLFAALTGAERHGNHADDL